MTPRARDIINGIARLRGVNPDKITAPCRIGKVYRARVEVSRALYAEGFSTTQIGRLLNHDHTTIVFYLGNAKRRVPKPRWWPPKVRELRVFKKDRPVLPRRPKPKYFLKPYAGADWSEYEWQEREVRSCVK